MKRTLKISRRESKIQMRIFMEAQIFDLSGTEPEKEEKGNEVEVSQFDCRLCDGEPDD